MTGEEQTITRYLEELDRSLSGLEESARSDIVTETATHLRESARLGRLNVTLRAFGPAALYASQFAAEESGEASPTQRQSSAFGGLAASLALGLLAVCFIAAAIVDLLIPTFGLWVNPASGAFFLGLASAGTRAVEIAGPWVFAAFLTAGVIAAFLSVQTAKLSLGYRGSYLKASLG